MAIKLPSSKETFEVALRFDSALDMNDEEYNEYLKSCEPAVLRVKEGDAPTFFILRKTLPYSLARKVQKSQLDFQEGGKVSVNLDFMMEEVRCSLVDVKNPPHIADEDKIVFKAAADGGASEELLAQLHAAGVVQDLYTARQNVCGKQNADLKKK